MANCGRVVLRPRGSGWELVAWRAAVPGGLPSSDDVTGCHVRIFRAIARKVHARPYPQPRRCRVSSSMPKWCAISCTTVTATSSRSSSSSSHTSPRASR